MNAMIITIGDEILIGQIVDTNSAWIGQQLQLLGISLVEIRSISDELSAIETALEEAFAMADLIIMTGGLGPTRDDMTKSAIARFFGVGFKFDPPTFERIEKFFEKRGQKPTEAHREQCFMPANAELLFNKMGSAPGMLFEKDKKYLVSMPGVPHEMKWIFSNQLLPKLKEWSPAIAIAHRTILTVGKGESRVAEAIRDIEDTLPEGVKLAYLPGLAQVRLRLTAKAKTQLEADQLAEEQKQRIVQRLGDLVYGFEKEDLASQVGKLLQERNLMAATAESCSGGYIAHQITSNSGSSNYFKGSIVAYSNEVKISALAVNPETLENHGAVSEQTVKEMVKGLLPALGVDVGISVSGIAGPGGGTPDKPVGTIWLAVGDGKSIKTSKLSLSKDRMLNIQYTSVVALNMLRKFLLEAE
ncbi:MAG: competence/damage-inducible protein A [Saprospiraceae bacterium]|nr:competence/damage-inducible protein A [Saprospiraceae bacterium]